MLKKIILIYGWLSLLPALAACSPATAEPTAVADGGPLPAETAPAATSTPAAEPLRPIRLPMGYIADPQFAPFYLAVDRGYFAEEGIELEFDYSFETDGVALVGAGELPFAIVSGEQVVLARAQALPVVYVFEWFERYPIAVISRQEVGLTEPEHLIGRSVGLPGFFGASYVGYAGLLSANDISLDQVNASEIGFTQVETLLTGQVEAVVGYVNNEPVQLRGREVAINVIEVADYVNLVANGVITNQQTLDQEPELVAAFVRALRRSLADTLADPQAAFESSKRFVEGLDEGRYSVLEASLDLWRADQLGHTDPAAWQQTEAVLLEIGFLDAPIEGLEKAYTNQFVE
ncbi:MAG: ABC transporter substrate-binding protein [Candidatus Promineifilaceae bacterium]